MTRSHAAFLCLVLLIGCEHVVPENPRVGIEVGQDSSGYVFSFWNCLDKSKPVQVRSINVYNEGDGLKGLPPECEVVPSEPKYHVKSSWSYGSVPAGYRRVRCNPLIPGKTYDIHVSGVGGGVRRFQILNDKSIKALDPACR